MNSLEIWFLNLGCSWMWSKLLPYCILFLLFSGSSFLLFYIKNFRNLWRIPLMILISLTPVTIYFALHPIYTGDIFDEAEEINTSYVFPKSKQLSIFVLKGCPHCKRTIPFIQKLRERNDQISIQYVIVGKPNDR
ncbi:MAG: hypothetical protein FJZ66_10370, partial [Bacteroidetes bacterium]|nr:hypothetical protein [Bacteroidota bacterium]